MTNEGDEMSAGSRGSHGDPVAWAVLFKYPGTGFQSRVDGFFTSEEQARQACDRRNEITMIDATVVPLYRQPQPTLTDEERDAIALAKSRLGTSDSDWQADDVLAALLERLG
jgi:hypothetical protein